ncbi:MAG: trypsin-like serine protease [Myxococcota bacterium]|nr:trypsin-like serine protease [Myxococcota bacterium]
MTSTQKILLALAALSAAACSEVDLELPEYTPGFGVVQQAIRHGVADDTNAYPNVVRLTIQVGQDFFLCSGTIVSPTAVLTAAHCVDNAAAASDVWAFVDGQSTQRASEIILHPNYSADAAHVRFAANDVYRFSGADLAILKFQNELGGPITQLATTKPNATDLLNVVGFGLNEEMKSGTRRVGQVEYVDVTETYMADRQTVDVDSGSFIVDPGPNNDGVCGGDSGGALFLGNRVLGVTSGGVVNNGNENVCVRMRNANFISVIGYRDWIVSHIGAEDADAPVEIDAGLTCDAANIDSTHGLTFGGSYSTNWGGLGEKWMKGADNKWFYIVPNGGVFKWNNGGRPLQGTEVGTLSAAFHDNPALLHDAADSGEDCATEGDTEDDATLAQRAFALDTALGFEKGNSYATNWGGQGEKWFADSQARWYFITPEGVLKRWNGGRPIDGTVAGIFSPAYHVNPALIHDAQDPTGPTACAADTPAAVAFGVSQTLNFAPTSDYKTNWSGLGEKWLKSDAGRWHFITPNGDLFAWIKGSSPARGNLVEQLGPAYYADPTLLTSATEPSAGNCGDDADQVDAVAANLDTAFGFIAANDYHGNWGGLDEKWIKGQGGKWFYLLPNGELYTWKEGSSPVSGTLVGTLNGTYHSNPTLLAQAAN